MAQKVKENRKLTKMSSTFLILFTRSFASFCFPFLLFALSGEIILHFFHVPVTPQYVTWIMWQENGFYTYARLIRTETRQKAPYLPTTFLIHGQKTIKESCNLSRKRKGGFNEITLWLTWWKSFDSPNRLGAQGYLIVERISVVSKR